MTKIQKVFRIALNCFEKNVSQIDREIADTGHTSSVPVGKIGYKKIKCKY